MAPRLEARRLQAIDPADDSLVLWAESPEEARNFLRRMKTKGTILPIDQIFVAKRSGRSRSNKYVGGEYYPTSNDDIVDVYNEVRESPREITRLVQWCTCDIMLSRGVTPVAVIEDTTHIVRMNLYQRVPRLALAAELGVPSIVLQGTVGLDFTKRGDQWAFHRYLQVFESLGRLFPHSPVLPIWYRPNTTDEARAVSTMFDHVHKLLNGDSRSVKEDRVRILSQVEAMLAAGVDGAPPRDIPCIDYRGSEVTVRIGAKPKVKSWREKGSGQMDPYIGLIAAAKYIYCYDEKSNKVKDLVIEFTHLPENFWFFEQRENATSLYKRLAFEIADRVVFLGSN